MKTNDELIKTSRNVKLRGHMDIRTDYPQPGDEYTLDELDAVIQEIRKDAWDDCDRADSILLLNVAEQLKAAMKQIEQYEADGEGQRFS